jgi:hypothetical protein
VIYNLSSYIKRYPVSTILSSFSKKMQEKIWHDSKMSSTFDCIKKNNRRAKIIRNRVTILPILISLAVLLFFLSADKGCSYTAPNFGSICLGFVFFISFNVTEKVKHASCFSQRSSSVGFGLFLLRFSSTFDIVTML